MGLAVVLGLLLHGVAIPVFLETAIKNMGGFSARMVQLFLTGKGQRRVPTLRFLTNPEVGFLSFQGKQSPPEPDEQNWHAWEVRDCKLSSFTGLA
jgi:hypothetical protein